MEEQWKDIKGYEGYYQVSDQGRVRGLDRTVPGGRWGTQFVKGGIISQVVRRDGYPTVHLRKDGKRIKHLVHRLVLEAFCGKRPEGMEARHLNDDKMDARLKNLEWGTRSENNLDRTKNKIGYYASREACRKGHEFVDANLVPNQLKLSRGPVKTCYACQKAHNTIKVHPSLSEKFQEVSDIHFENLVGERKRMTFNRFSHLLQ